MQGGSRGNRSVTGNYPHKKPKLRTRMSTVSGGKGGGRRKKGRRKKM